MSKSGRLTFIDVLRGAACVWMIETHVLNAFMTDYYRSGWLYEAVSLSNGFVAVTFIFCAGAGFWLAADRKFEEYTTLSPTLSLYIRRLLFILITGYWIQTPEFSLERTLASSPQEWMKFFQCNVLQLIVYSSFLALLLLALLRSRKRLILASFTIMGLLFILTPNIWYAHQSLQHLPLPLHMLFAPQPLSPFPLFPWAGYFFAGLGCTALFMQSELRKKLARQYIIIGLICIAMAFLVKNTIALPGNDNWWYASPGHAFFRAAGALILFSLLYLYQEKLSGRISSFLQLLGRESLVVYVGQGMLIYGSVASKGLQYFLPIVISPVGVSVLTACITAAMGTYAQMWNHYKQLFPLRARFLLLAFCILFIAAFIIIPA